MADGFSLGALLGSLAGMAQTGNGLGAADGAEPASGLFGALLTNGVVQQDSVNVAPDARPVEASLLAVPFQVQGLKISQPEGLPLQLSGEAQAVQVLAQQVTILYQQITVQGGFQFGAKGQAGDLATALTKLGLPADEAQALAAKIDTMLELIRQQAMLEKEKLSSAAGGSLVAVLLASLMNSQQLQTLEVPTAAATQITQVQIQLTQTQVSVSAGSWQAVQARAQGVPAASTLLQSSEAAPIQFKPQAAPSVPQVVASVQNVPLETLPEASTQPAPRPTVAIALPAETKPQTLPPQVPLPTVQPVAAPKPLQGTVVYKLTEAQPGTPVLQALAVPQVVAAETASASAVTPAVTPQELQPETPLVPTEPAKDSLTGFNLVATTTAALEVDSAPTKPTLTHVAATLERLHLAQTAQAAQQVQLAIQPLLNNAKGGAIQMVLNPPELGKIEVHLKIENGQIHGVVAAQEPAVIEHLARELPNLRQSFLDAGLKIADQGLSLMLSNQNNPDQQPQQNPFAALNDERTANRRGGEGDSGIASATTIVETATTPARWVSPTQLVDVAA
jgi:flagellar hook-length control protein FliK